jgi:hypothetical protein
MLLMSGVALRAQLAGAGAGAAEAIGRINEQRFRAQLLAIQPEPDALNPFGARFHEAVYIGPTANAVDLLTINGHVLCQATTTNESLLGWLVQRRRQFVDVSFETR